MGKMWKKQKMWIMKNVPILFLETKVVKNLLFKDETKIGQNLFLETKNVELNGTNFVSIPKKCGMFQTK